MSFGLSVKSNIDEVRKDLSRLEKRQVPAATQWALNGTARKVKLAEKREMKRVIRNPKPFTTNGLWIKWAKKHKPEAEVKLIDYTGGGTAVADYLRPIMNGGARRHKGFEKLLIAKGQMPSGMFAVPSRTMKRNKYGNVSPGMIQKILSGLGSQRDIYQNARKGSKSFGKYFSGIIGNVHGIWDVKKLHAGQPALLFIFVSSAPKYKKIYDFEAVARKTSKTVFNREFVKAMRKALATAH